MTGVSPLRTLGISVDEYKSQLRSHIEYEREVQKEENHQLLNGKSRQYLQYADIGFIPSTTPLNFYKISASFEVPSEDPDDIDIRGDFGIFEDQIVEIQAGVCDNNQKTVFDSFEGKVAEIDGSTVTIAFPDIVQSEEDLKRVSAAVSKADFAHIGELLSPTVYDRQDNAVREIEDHKIKLICGDRDVEFEQDHSALVESDPLDNNLYENEKQEEAIRTALSAKDVACIQGPPGTGKTRVIIEIIRRFINSGHKVLVTAETHQAVSNILVGESTLRNPDNECLHYHARIHGYDVNRVNPKPDKIGPFEKKHYGKEKGRGDVYITTNNSAATIRPTLTFDVAIIDEATQARQASTMIPYSKADTAILVGDHKQLGPQRPYTPDLDREPPNLDIDPEESLFTLLYGDNGVFGDGLGTMFDTQYRMHPDIAKFPSDEFYNGCLQTGKEISHLNGLQPVIGFDVRNRAPKDQEKNYEEAKEVVTYVSNLVKYSDVDPSEIGIAGAYRKQTEVLRNYVRQEEEIDQNDILVDTFDSFQGTERSVMVLSFTRSNRNGRIGYLSGQTGQRRLNVALTRAKRHCAMFGDWDTLANGSTLFERLRNHIEENGQMNKPS